MNSRRLRHFLAVYEHGSLGRAATALNLTQPGLSKSIHQLERELKVQLFDRTPKGIVPTIYGDALSLHARRVDSELQIAEREIAMLSGAAKGQVRVGVTPSVAASLAPLVVSRLHEERPGIQLTVLEGLVEEHVPALRRGEMDVVVGGWARGIDPDLTTEPVFADVVRAWARSRHPLASGRAALSELLQFPWALPPHTQFWRDHLDRAFVAEGLAPPLPAVVSNSASFIRSMLRESDCLSYLPSTLLGHDVELGEVVALDAAQLDIRIDIHIMHRPTSAVSPAVSAFIETLRAVGASVTGGRGPSASAFRAVMPQAQVGN